MNSTIGKILVISTVAILALGSQAYADFAKSHGFHGWDSHETTKPSKEQPAAAETEAAPEEKPAAESAAETQASDQQSDATAEDQPAATAQEQPAAQQPAETKDDINAKIEAERQKFYDDTKDLRDSIKGKRTELRTEISKQNPDMQTALGLQKELSELRAYLDQKRLDHVLRMKQIDPDFGHGKRGKYGKEGPGNRRPGQGPGTCSGCPYEGKGKGYGMGPGKGKEQGPGGGEEQGPGGGEGKASGPIDRQAAIKIVENYLSYRRNPNLELGKITDAGENFEAEIVTRDKSLVDKILIDKNSGAMKSAY